MRLCFLGYFVFTTSFALAQQIHVVSTTDLHGHLAGIDTMMGYFDIAKQLDPETMFLDSGDMFQGTIISN